MEVVVSFIVLKMKYENTFCTKQTIYLTRNKKNNIPMDVIEEIFFLGCRK